MWISISLLLLSTLGTLSAFGGETWSKGDKPLIQRITLRGWISLLCLTSAFALGAVREKTASDEAADKDNYEKQQHAALQDTQKRLDQANSTLKTMRRSLDSERETLAREEKLVMDADGMIKAETRLLGTTRSDLLHQDQVLSTAQSNLNGETLQNFMGLVSKDYRIDRMALDFDSNRNFDETAKTRDLLFPSLPTALQPFAMLRIALYSASPAIPGNLTGDQVDIEKRGRRCEIYLNFNCDFRSNAFLCPQKDFDACEKAHRPPMVMIRGHWRGTDPDVLDKLALLRNIRDDQRVDAALAYSEITGGRPLATVSIRLIAIFNSEQDEATYFSKHPDLLSARYGRILGSDKDVFEYIRYPGLCDRLKRDLVTHFPKLVMTFHLSGFPYYNLIEELSVQSPQVDQHDDAALAKATEGLSCYLNLVPNGAPRLEPERRSPSFYFDD